MTALAAEGLTVTIGDVTACNGLDVTFNTGECWAVLGRNGVGKTTLLHTLAGLRAPDAGEVWLDGARLRRLSPRTRARRLGLLPQETPDFFPASVLETALMGRHPHIGPWGWEGEADLVATRGALAAVALESFAERPVTALSGGERRRLALATLMTQSPSVWLLDEPSNHLDLRHQVNLLELLRQYVAESGGVIVMTLHDVNLAARLCDRVLLLFGEGAYLAAPAEQALAVDHLERVYGHPIRVVDDGERRAYLPA